MSRYDNKYGIDIKTYCAKHACLDCKYFDNQHFVEINKNCPLLELKNAVLIDGFMQAFTTKTPLSVVSKADDENVLKIVNLSGGKDSTALLLMLLELGVKIDYIVFADTGKDFPQMRDHLFKLSDYIKNKYPLAPKITVLKDENSFDYYMFDHIKTRGKNIGKCGYGWATMFARWCTTKLKTSLMNKFCNSLGKDYINYIGIAADEPKRLHKDPHRAYPLADWGITENQALKYCYACGFDWGGLYERFDRVSCWCCPFKNLKELKALWKYYPELWAELKIMDARANNRFRADYSVAELEQKFIKEEAADNGGN